MAKDKKRIIVLLVEDDEDYYLLMKEAFQKTGFVHDLHWVKDGEELMNYLEGSELSGYVRELSRQMIILLDLNMPRMNGFQALQKIKSDNRFRHIPTIILTTSKSEEDIVRSYDLGANAFITKPADFRQMTGIIDAFQRYWLDIVKLPLRN